MTCPINTPWSLRLKEGLVAPAWRLYRKLETDLHPLRYFFWEATLRCNFSCLHCGSDCRSEPKGPELDADTVLNVFRDVAKAYDSSKIMVVVTGGEALVRKDLLSVMGEVRRMGFRWGLVSNGYLIDEKMAHACRQHGLTSVVVSVDGPEELHEWLRQRKGSYQRAIRALTALRDAGVPTVEAITCVSKRNLDALDATYALVKEARATHWRLFNIFPIGRAAGDPELILSAEELRQLLGTIARLRQQGQREGMKVNYSEEGYLDPCLDVQVRDTRYFCRAGINVAGLLADGSVAACPNLPPSLSQGNVRDSSLVEIWEKKYQVFRDRSWMKTGTCAECGQWSDCQGNALHGYNFEEGRPGRCHLEETRALAGAQV